MGPKEKLAALSAEAATLREKMNAGTLTDEDRQRAADIATEAEGYRKAIEEDEKLAGLLDTAAKSNPGSVQKNGEDVGGTMGSRFVNSPSMKRFREEHSHGISDGAPVDVKAKSIGGYASKVLTTGTTGNAAPVRTGEVDDLVYRPRPSILDLVTRGTTNLPWIQYRQVISKTNNAAIVAEATTTDGTTPATGLKPLSTLTTQPVDAKAHTYADGMEVTNQELSDDGVIQTLIDATLRENLDLYVGNMLLNGTGSGGAPVGILNTTGVLQQDFDTDPQVTIRKAITKLRNTSGAPITGVLLNPADNEAWDLLKGTDGHYLGAGPYAQGIPTAWGYQRIEDPNVPVGTAVLGDFRTVHFLMYEALSILAFNQHKDYAQRNLVYIRAEFRALQMIRNAARLAVADLTAA